MNEMTERQDSNFFQQIRNTKNRTIVRPTTFTHICYLTWQGFQVIVQTLDDEEFEKINLGEIRQLLDEGVDQSKTESHQFP